MAADMWNVRARVRGPFTFAVHAAVGVLAGVIAFTATAAFASGWFVPAVAAAITAPLAAWLVLRPHRHVLPGVPATFQVLFVAGALAVAIVLVRLTVFIMVPDAAGWSVHPDSPFMTRHSCVSAYYFAGGVVTTVPDVYDTSVYSLPQPPGAPRRPRTIGPFNLDIYEYPPTFLLLPRLLRLVTPDFFDFRRLWFAGNLLVVAIGLVAVSRRIDAALGTWTLWLTPFALVPLAITLTFQIGNVQLAFIALPLLGMLALERGRLATGGLLLGFAAVSKLFPALLIVYLLLRRNWRGAAWTIGACAAFALVTLADVGWTPFAAFLGHLPKLLSGEAFTGPLLGNPDAAAINQSVPGIVFKLRYLGGPLWSFGAARIVGWAYTAVVLWVIWWLARCPIEPGRAPLVWLAILILASMRSPFLPQYGLFPSVWLATLAVGVWWAIPGSRVLCLVLWAVLAVDIAQGAASPPVNSVLTFGQTLAAFGLVVATTRMQLPATSRAT
jgi:alpha-1,2-mannosyltransferase